MFGLKVDNCLSALGTVGSAATMKVLLVLNRISTLNFFQYNWQRRILRSFRHEFWPPSNRIFADRQNCLSDFISIVIIICLVSFTSCGYRFAGSEGPPKGIERLFIQLLDNKTTEPDVDNLITSELKNEFIQKYRGVLVHRDQADAVLSGAVVGIRTETVAKRGALTSLERRVYMTIDLTLKSSGSEQVWFAKGITDSDTYAVDSGDKEATEQNKRNALIDLANRIAEISFNRLSDDF